jgi:Tol biopolymer transport system component
MNAKHLAPQWSPDGSQLAYAAGQGLYVIPAFGGQPSKLAHTEKGWWPVRWSPDGKHLAALSKAWDEDSGPGNAVFVVPVSGGELRQLTPDVKVKGAIRWHPDGQRLTYGTLTKGMDQAYLDGRPPSLLFEDPDSLPYEGVWEPNGKRFFFRCCGGVNDIRIYDEASGEITPFYAGNARTVPCFSRDGKTIAWGIQENVTQIWTMEDRSPEPAAAR